MNEVLGCAAYGLIIALLDQLEEQKAMTAKDGQRVFVNAAKLLEQQAGGRKRSVEMQSSSWLKRMHREALAQEQD